VVDTSTGEVTEPNSPIYNQEIDLLNSTTVYNNLLVPIVINNVTNFLGDQNITVVDIVRGEVPPPPTSTESWWEQLTLPGQILVPLVIAVILGIAIFFIYRRLNPPPLVFVDRRPIGQSRFRPRHRVGPATAIPDAVDPYSVLYASDKV
jgi:hypothetical protein